MVNVARIAALVMFASFGMSIGLARADQTTDASGSKPALPPQPTLIIRFDELFPLTPTRLGMFTLVPPETNGEFVRMAIPIGELVSRAARAISDANHRRAERKADERVRKDLEQFLVRSKSKDPNTP